MRWEGDKTTVREHYSCFFSLGEVAQGEGEHPASPRGNAVGGKTALYKQHGTQGTPKIPSSVHVTLLGPHPPKEKNSHENLS